MCDVDDFSDDGTDDLLCSLPNEIFSQGTNNCIKEEKGPTISANDNFSFPAPNIKTVTLKTPEEFPFPFEPYGIQLQFMKALYACLQEGKIGIFESPTGTGKSLSLICGAFKWLRDFKEEQQKELDKLLAKKTCETCVNDDPKELDWITEFSMKKKKEEELKQLEEEKKALNNVENKLGHMRERYNKPTKRKCHQLESEFEELKDSFSEEVQKAFMAEMKEINSQNPSENGDNEDAELVVEEYFSDNEEKIKSDSDQEDDNSEQEHTLKIYYCSRTHSQLSQFVREIMKSPYGDDAKVTSLASRQNLCINEAVQSLKSLTLINDRCLELQKPKKGSKSKSDQPKKRSKNNSCPFYKVENIEDFRDRVLVEVRDIEQLSTLGKQMKSCPYYGTRYAIPNAEIVLLPYNTLLHRTTRNSCGIKVKDNIIIVDEAHNLLETINNIHSVEITGAQMCRAHSQLSQYEQRYRSRLKAKNLMYINQILFILSRFINYIGGKLNIASNEQHLSKIESKIMTINDFLYETKLDNINLFKVLNYCKKSLISKKLNGFVEKYQPSSVNYVPLKTNEAENNQSGLSQFLKELSEKNKPDSNQGKKAALQVPEISIPSIPEMNSPLMQIEGFLEALTNADKDGRMVLNRKSLLSVSSIKFLLLNPAVEFEAIVKEARSVVIAGGTMQPVSEFKEQLFSSIGVHPDRILEYSCGHVIPDDHLLPIALATGPSGREMDFTYQYRDKPQTLEELGHVICNICNIIPGGIVCFFPSYDYEAKVFEFWTKSGIIRRISTKKKKLQGPPTSNGLMGAVLFSVVGGKMSEGINFSDDLGRCVVLVGLPFPNINSPELKEKMDYLNANYPRAPDGQMPGQIHYENLCMKAVNQSIGRAIRHQKDYAVVLLLDRRYQKPSVAAKLPNWIRTLLRNFKFGQAVGAISKFFASKI